MKERTMVWGWCAWLVSFLLCACGPGQIFPTHDDAEGAVDCVPDDPNGLRFEQAVCLCGDLDKVGSGLTTSSFSSYGRRTDTLRKAHVGINGDARSTGVLKVDGDLDVAGGVDTIAAVMIKRDLFVGSDLETQGHTSIDYDAYVGGSVIGAGGLEVGGRLQVSGDISMTGALHCDQVATGVPFLAHTPCSCDPADLIDVAAEVAANRGAQPLDLPSGNGKNEIVLGGGDYYASDGTFLQGTTRIRVESSARLFIEGDLEFMGSAFVELADGAELDIYIAGAVRKIGNLQVGWPKKKAATRDIRVYIGGTDSIAVDVTGNTRFEGALYAPQADVIFNGNLIIEGSLFARNLVGTGHVLVRYDAGLTGGGCDPTQPGGDNGGDDGGGNDDDWECIPGDDAFPCPGETGHEDGS